MKIIIFIAALMASIATVAREQNHTLDMCGNLEVIKRSPPSFPVMESYIPVTGEVELTFSVNPRGATENIVVIKSTSSDQSEKWKNAFAHEAIKAVTSWIYTSPSVACTSSITLSFEVEM